MSALVVVSAVFFMPRSASDPQPLLKAGASPCFAVQLTAAALSVHLRAGRRSIDPHTLPASKQVLLQDAAWGEASREQKREARLEVLSQYADVAQFRHAPLFCMATTLKVGGKFGPDLVLIRHCKPMYAPRNSGVSTRIVSTLCVNRTICRRFTGAS